MSVDANAEGGPPKAVIAEVDVNVKSVDAQNGVSSTAGQYPAKCLWRSQAWWMN